MTEMLHAFASSVLGLWVWRVQIRLSKYNNILFLYIDISDSSDRLRGMPLINDFTEFDAFKKCREFVRIAGALTRTESIAADPDLTRQIRRALVSILSNFAEGFEREGRQEFLQFLSISKGSVGEVRAQLIYALDQGYLTEEHQVAADAIARQATRLIGGLMKHLRRCEIPGRKYLSNKEASSPKLSTEPSTWKAKPQNPKRKTQNAKLKTQNYDPSASVFG